jgi:hypothetical protein
MTQSICYQQITFCEDINTFALLRCIFFPLCRINIIFLHSLKKTMKKTLFWIIAIVITLASVIYQRITGPTNPVQYDIVCNGTSEEITFPRSHAGLYDCVILLELPQNIEGEIVYRRYPSYEKWDTAQFFNIDGELMTKLPHQPPAGKLEYFITLWENDDIILKTEEALIIRFRNEVPAWAMIPHILLMFLAMLCGNAAGLFAFAKMENYKRLVATTVILFFFGGFIFGPIVQKFSFDAYWTGFPFGKDLTDNKVLIALIFWIFAWVSNIKKRRIWTVILAALLFLSIYMIPHSMNGSELNHETGEVITG